MLCLPYFMSKCDNCFENFNDGLSIIFLLGFGELIVRHKIGMLFVAVVSPGTIGPALLHPLLSPVIMIILSELLY